MDAATEIAIAAALQLGALIWLLSGMKADMRNQSAWLRNLADEIRRTANLAHETRVRVEQFRQANHQ